MLKEKFCELSEIQIDKEVQNFKHEHKECLCFNCNNLHAKENIQTYRIHGRGYGSVFDTMDFNIQLCPDCAEKIDVNCFNNAQVGVLGIEEIYYREDLLEEFIDGFRIENQEYIYNTDSYFEDKIARKDWIEMMKEENEDIRDEMAWGFYKKNEIIKSVIEDALQEELQDVFCEHNQKVDLEYLNELLDNEREDLKDIDNKMEEHKDNICLVKMLNRHKSADLIEIEKIKRYIKLIVKVYNAAKEIA